MEPIKKNFSLTTDIPSMSKYFDILLSKLTSYMLVVNVLFSDFGSIASHQNYWRASNAIGLKHRCTDICMNYIYIGHTMSFVL